jgi:hypothetical protein
MTTATTLPNVTSQPAHPNYRSFAPDRKDIGLMVVCIYLHRTHDSDFRAGEPDSWLFCFETRFSMAAFYSRTVTGHGLLKYSDDRFSFLAGASAQKSDASCRLA